MLSLIFDIDDTIYERYTPFRKAYNQIFKDEPNLNTRLLFERFVIYGNEVFEASMNGTISMEEMWIYRIKHALKDFHTDISLQQALEFQNTYVWQQHHIELSDTMTKLFNQCKEKGITLGLITNGTSEHQRMKFHTLRLERWFSEKNLLITGDIGINKPDLAVFKEAEKRMHLDLSETWYIGDSYRHDIVGAKTAGWNTIWVDWNKKAVQDCMADYIVHSEEELKDCIQNLIFSILTIMPNL